MKRKAWWYWKKIPHYWLLFSVSCQYIYETFSREVSQRVKVESPLFLWCLLESAPIINLIDILLQSKHIFVSLFFSINRSQVLQRRKTTMKPQKRHQELFFKKNFFFFNIWQIIWYLLIFRLDILLILINIRFINIY